MFHAFFDCSHDGKQLLESGSVTVAGWLSSGEQWENFDRRWRTALLNHGVPYLHMKDFAHSTGTFKLWEGDEVRRRALLAALIPIIQDCTKAAFLCTVERKAFSAVNADYDLDNYYGNEYALCALVCVQHVQRWIIDQGIYEAAENIFEAGDRRGNLINLMHELSYSEPVFRSPRDTVNDQGVFVPGIVALQASDWLAYEVRGAYDKLGENEAAPYRKSLRELARITAHKGSQSIITEEALRGICTKLNLPHR